MTDRRTDGHVAVAKTRYSIYAVARKNECRGERAHRKQCRMFEGRTIGRDSSGHADKSKMLPRKKYAGGSIGHRGLAAAMLRDTAKFR